jgi:hypothetical protein
MIQNLFQYCTFFMEEKRTLYVEGMSVCLSVTKSHQPNHFSGLYEIWCTGFFNEKLSRKHKFRENRSIDSLMSFKSFM